MCNAVLKTAQSRGVEYQLQNQNEEKSFSNKVQFRKKISTRKLRKCEMELAAILLQMCDIWSHTSRYFYLRKRQDFFFQTKFFIRGIYLLNLEGYFSLSIFYWFVSDRNNLNNLCISKSKKTVWVDFEQDFLVRQFFLFFRISGFDFSLSHVFQLRHQ